MTSGTTVALPHIRFMTRRDCCLCDDAKAVVVAAVEQGLCTWEAVNVDTDKALLVRYGMDVPVLVCEDKVLFKHRVTETELQDALLQIQNGEMA
ncbi:glutaredoxin family protein [Mariprofundus erugo]|nr:glutaredoxin family protein [Mariprofundus erugo]